MDAIIILQAGVATGTVLLFATIGEIFAERSGVFNLGVEGMMLIGAMTAFSTTIATGNPWLGVLAAMLAAGLISQVHAFITITLQADQVVSGLALTFLGTGISLVLGEGLSKAGTVSLLPNFSIPLLSQIPISGTDFVYQTKRAGLHRLPVHAAGMVLHQSHTPGSATCVRWVSIPPPRIRSASAFFDCVISMSLSADYWPVWREPPSASPLLRAGSAS